MSQIHHINISVSDIKKSRDFYDSILFTLGFIRGIDEYGEWGAVIGYKGDNIEFEIIHETDKNYQPFNRFVGLNHIAFQAKSKEQVDDLYNTVKGEGVVITRKPRLYPEYSDTYYAFFFRDPDDIPLEIVFC